MSQKVKLIENAVENKRFRARGWMTEEMQEVRGVMNPGLKKSDCLEGYWIQNWVLITCANPNVVHILIWNVRLKFRQNSDYGMGLMFQSLIPSRANTAFSSPKPRDLPAHPSSSSVDTGGFFSLGVKQMGHKADHLPVFSAKIKNEWSYICGVSTCAFIACMWTALLYLYS